MDNFWENYLVGLFIASLVSSIVFPSMLISALAPLDKNSLEWKISENPQRFQILETGIISFFRDKFMDPNGPCRRERKTVDICILLLLVNLLDFLLDLGLTPRSSLELLNCQPESQILVRVFLLHVSQQFLK